MISLTIVLVALAVLFVIFLGARSVMGFKVCALCASVSSTWILLLILMWSGSSVDPLLIGVLMGGSVVGLMYLLEEKVPKRYLVFKFPFVLTLFALVYLVLSNHLFSPSAYVVLLFFWIVFVTFFLYRGDKSLSGVVKKIVECCKNW